MMFGTVPLSYKGMTTKIHFMDSPKPQILLTKLFSINPSDLESNPSGRRGSFSSTSSDTSLSSSAQGSAMTTNGSRNASKESNSIFFDDFSEFGDDDTFRAVPSYASLPSSFRIDPSIHGLRVSGASVISTPSPSTSPRIAFANRRLRRFSYTSMENGIFNPTPLPGSMTPRCDQLPSSVCRPWRLTIIAGTDENTVCRILFVLSYFIRCNEIFERSEDLIPLELQREEECKTSLNYDKNLSSESTPSDGFLSADELFVKSYGRSLMAGYCDKYMSDFVLMGLPKLDEFQDSLAVDLKNSLRDHIRNVNEYFVPLNTKSDYVSTMLHQCKDLYTKIGMPAESYLEDRLRILYHKAIMYKNYSANLSTAVSISSQNLFVQPSKNEQVPVNMLEALGLHQSDLQLVYAVSSTL
ncbi:13641_t:CDS:2 [Racocetra fulgida]|uniref:13641_t:CDS:1 n=1 Tax=Racocetra fulgida TaxID=60492 RepID=A0A9N9F7N3_9GLOM|nr:13641_t:CDS:2 [Racocetra fulgida]